MQDYSITKMCVNDGVLHYIDEASGDVIKSYAGRVEGRLGDYSFAFNVNRSWWTILRRSRLMSRLLRLDRINVLKIAEARLLIIYNREVFICELNTGQPRKVFKFERTRYVHTQSIALHGERIVIGEYGNVGDSKEVGILLSVDAGLSWEYRPLFSRGTTKNILAVKYDWCAECYWVFTGDTQKESAIFLFDQDFNLVKSLGRGLDYRAISSFFLPDQVVWLTNNPFGTSRVLIYDRTTGTIEVGPALPGPVWYSTKIGNDIYCCTAAEDVAGEPGDNVYVLHSRDYIHWDQLCAFKKDGMNKRLFLYGLGTFPEIGAPPSHVYINLDAVEHLDGCVVMISRDPMPRSQIEET